MITPTQKATREQSKNHNKRLILKMVCDHTQISRAEIARNTHLTATTVSSIISGLIEEGLVEEAGSLSTERGKPPTLVRLVKDARHIISLDISRNVFRGGVLNLRGEVGYQHEMPADGLTGEQALASVYTLIDLLLANTSQPVLGIGIGTPGIIDSQQGVVQQAVNLGWQNLRLRDQLHTRYNLPAQVVNDNQAALQAEHLFGDYRTCENLVVIRVGTGIGAGIMQNGHLLTSYGVGEIGHVTVVDGGERCSCGNFGCLETVASNRAIVKLAKAIIEANQHSYLSKLAGKADAITIDTVLQAFADGDRSLDPIVATVGRFLGTAIAHLIGVLGVSELLLMGRVAQFGQPLLDCIHQEVTNRSFTARLNPPKIRLVNPSINLSDIIMRGAAASLLTSELGLF